jgi:HSP20 family protein
MATAMDREIDQGQEMHQDNTMEVDTMLMRTDPFRELDRWTQQLFGATGTPARPTWMPMDAWRDGDTFHVELDLPGVDADSIDLDVERHVVTVKAERRQGDDDVEVIAAERPRGVFSRQLVLGDNLDVDHITAAYVDGVLQLVIPVAEESKPRRIAITAERPDGTISAHSTDSADGEDGGEGSQRHEGVEQQEHRAVNA